MHVFTCVQLHAGDIHVHVHVCVCMRAQKSISAAVPQVHSPLYMCVCMYVYACVYVCMYVYICLCTYVHIPVEVKD